MDEQDKNILYRIVQFMERKTHQLYPVMVIYIKYFT